MGRSTKKEPIKYQSVSLPLGLLKNVEMFLTEIETTYSSKPDFIRCAIREKLYRERVYVQPLEIRMDELNEYK